METNKEAYPEQVTESNFKEMTSIYILNRRSIENFYVFYADSLLSLHTPSMTACATLQELLLLYQPVFRNF